MTAADGDVEPERRSRKIRRQLPRWSDFRSLLKFRRPEFNARRRRLAAAYTIDDLRTAASKRVPKSVFDYVDGAAEQELSLARARTVFDSIEFHPRVLRDVSAIDTSAEILGQRSALPLVLAPTGFTRMMNHEGESAVARAAARANIPYVLSTMGTTELEDLRAAAPTARQWFQLYLWKDRDASEALVERAHKANYEAIMLTVDTPIGGARMRDLRNGLTIPPTLTARTFAGMVIRPSWWFNLLTTEPLKFAAMSGFDGTVEELIAQMFDPSITVDDLTWLRSRWSRKLVVKGIQERQGCASGRRPRSGCSRHFQPRRTAARSHPTPSRFALRSPRCGRRPLRSAGGYRSADGCRPRGGAQPRGVRCDDRNVPISTG